MRLDPVKITQSNPIESTRQLIGKRPAFSKGSSDYLILIRDFLLPVFE